MTGDRAGVVVEEGAELLDAAKVNERAAASLEDLFRDNRVGAAEEFIGGVGVRADARDAVRAKGRIDSAVVLELYEPEMEDGIAVLIRRVARDAGNQDRTVG